ncbi:maleylpyruvate isomerase family mycothiol-dependent enzyme [Micromonospora sp. WMMD737]|uniref:maleylpyruvate isomerase family mycothiol-dependent enzyme n=1 Tax=Micromonospora sp. WMMD737 TaxID=3404113 RepID=UPI003B948390
MTREEVQDLTMVERDRLVADLSSLADEAWQTASLCSGWTVRDLTAHLLMPYEISALSLLGQLARARFRFDRVADEWARRDPRTPDQLLTALNSIDGKRFGTPGVSQAAGLSHLVAHKADLYRPLGLDHVVGPTVGVIVLNELVGRGRGSLPDGILDGRRFTASDLDWSYGTGEQVAGPASALITTLLGRDAALGELSGPGVPGVVGQLRRA